MNMNMNHDTSTIKGKKYKFAINVLEGCLRFLISTLFSIKPILFCIP